MNGVLKMRYLQCSLDVNMAGRKVIARQTSYHIDHHLVCNTLKQALFRPQFPKDVLIHSDQGNQNIAVLSSSNYCYNMN